jgi:hypothetical protein
MKKTESPVGNESELRMPADEFDSIMGKVLGAGSQEKRGGKLNDLLNDQKKHPGQLPTKGGRQYTDVRVTETPGTIPAPPLKPEKK